MKKLLILGLVLSVFVMFLVLGCKEGGESKSKEVSKSKKESFPVASIPALTALEFCHELRSNEASFSTKYQGRPIRVRGTIFGFESFGLEMQPNCKVDGGYTTVSIMCRFSTSDLEPLGTFSRGDEIEIVGMYNGDDFGWAGTWLEGCIVVPSDWPPGQNRRKEQPAAATSSNSSAPSGSRVRTDLEPVGAVSDHSEMEGILTGEVRDLGGIEMVWCPPGEFLMGSPEGEEGRSNKEHQHRVKLTHGFWLAKHECTQAQWSEVMSSNPSRIKGADLPVADVSWNDVQGWLARMNERHPLPAAWRWELPTEAEWEYACRAGTEGAFGGAGNLDEMGWHCTNSELKTYSAAGKKPNAWGFYDFHGNVAE